MAHREGGERVFPAQLMTVRRGKNGTVRSVFLTADGSDYCSSVINLFASSLGQNREQIEEKVKELELKSQNPRIVRGLSLIMFRISSMEPPSYLVPSKVRSMIFRSARFPAVSPEERDSILQKVAESLGTTQDDVKNAMYADKESEQVLTSLPSITAEELAARFNIEQVETVMLKSTSITITTEKNLPIILRKVRSLGLLHETRTVGSANSITVSGPLAVVEHTERYGSRFASLIRFLFGLNGWEADAKVSLGQKGDRSDYSYHIDDASLEYFRHRNTEESYPAGFGPPFPINCFGNTVYPDYSARILDTDVAVFITRPLFYEDDRQIVKMARESGFSAELFCVVDKGSRCPAGARCFKDSPDFSSILEYLKHVYGQPRFKGSGAGKVSDEKRTPIASAAEGTRPSTLPDSIKIHLDELYPDSQAMVDYLDFMGFEPATALELAGYSVRWKGLRIEVEKAGKGS